MGTISERRIIDLGRGSFVITLPKPWVRFHGLRAGDTLVVKTNGGLKVTLLKRKAAAAQGPGENGGQTQG